MKFFWIVLIAMMPSVGFAQIIIVSPYPSTPCKVDFEDFIAFAQAFNSREGDPNYNRKADINSDGFVNFTDFIAFAQVFGLPALDVPATKQFLDPKCYQSSYEVSGRVTHLGRSFENVWVDVWEAGNPEAKTTNRTNKEGYFELKNVYNGEYWVVPQKYGYTFVPDTLSLTVQDTSVIMPPFQAVCQFELVSVKVEQEGLPVDDVRVQISRNIAGQATTVLGSGVTDLSGLTAIQIPVRDNQVDVSGYYMVSVVDVASKQVLDSWANIVLQSGDLRCLVLDVGKDAYYTPERVYFYYPRYDNKRVVLKPSEQYLKIWFREDVDESRKLKLLEEMKLKDSGNSSFELTNSRGSEAIVEALHKIKRSGLVKAVTPSFDFQPYTFYRSHHVIVDFKAGTSESSINQFLEEMGATVFQLQRSGSYEIEVFDLLSQDVFEICEQFRNHPLIKYIQPDIQQVYVLF